jgi:peptidoglycan hydrolase-like protein with peptidoglycan-binding domain
MLKKSRKKINSKMSMRGYMSRNQNLNMMNNTPKPQMTIFLKEGNTGEEVEALQTMLSNIADMYPNMLIVTINGIFDDATKTAVKEFQENVGLDGTGIVDNNTWNKLMAVNEKKFSDKVLPDYLDESYNVLKKGSKGKFVIKLQEYLNAMANKYPSLPKLKVDGEFGPKTEAAVLAFQNLFNLTEDGIVGNITWSVLYNEYIKLI